VATVRVTREGSGGKAKPLLIPIRFVPSYRDEFVFRHNHRRTPLAAFQTLLGLGTSHQPTTYEQIVARRHRPLAELTG
jgi:hypothetical protein